MNQQRLLFLSHGGGPLPLLGDPGHQEMVTCLKALAAKIKKPSAILVISAHWEESVPTLTAGAAPELIYDYYGFPPAAYQIQYPCAGEPQLAQKIQALLEDAGIPAKLDFQRGFDHGMFIPLTIMYPLADIPCVQLSLVNHLDPAQHIAIGAALQSLDEDNLLVIGSGLSFHNLREFPAPSTEASTAKNEAFEAWLLDTCANTALSESERAQKLIAWEQAPAARYCHPREEHLIPLHVCYGMAQTASHETFELPMMRKKVSMYLW